MSKAYDKLQQHFEKIHQIEAAVLTLQDDAQKYMPLNSASDRLTQMKTLLTTANRLVAAPEVGTWLEVAQKGRNTTLPEADQKSLDNMRARWMHQAVFPPAPAPRDVTAYKKLEERFATINILGNASAMIRSYAKLERNARPEGTPEDENPPTDAQCAVLASVSHALIAAPEVKQWLDEAEKTRDALPKEERRNLELMRKQWVHEAFLSEEMVAKHQQLETEGERRHTALRDTGDWARMRDWYKQSFDTMREIGEAKKGPLGVATAYEALMDSFMPGLPAKDVAREMEKLEKSMPALIREAVERQKLQEAPVPLTGPFPLEQQYQLGKELAAMLGFDFTRGRLDLLKDHPESGGTAGDIRFTTRGNPNDFLEALLGVAHETGHANYEQGTPQKWRLQPAGQAPWMDIHESQSRIVEVLACHTPEFCRLLEKMARRIFNRPDDPALDAKNLERLINRATPSFIRTEADELTYSTHVILRYKIERDMINGDMTVDDIPRVWNKGMKDMLGIDVPDPSKGHMQDVHWPVGYVGYFPAYTLGDMRAAQLWNAALKARPEIPSEIEKGNFAPLTGWLRENVHSKASLVTRDELDIGATGEKLDAKYYLDHLSRRFLGRPWEEPKASPASPSSAPSPS